MKPSDRDAFRAKLEKDLKTVGAEVAVLFSQREVFRELARLFTENRALGTDWTQLHTFLFGGYVTQACMRLRRLMDENGQTVSLANIVSRVCQHPTLLTRADYVARFSEGHELPFVREHREDEANQLFNRFAGPEGPCLDPVRLCRFCLPARWKWEVVRRYVNKRLAHYDRKGPHNPTWGELDRAIDAVGDLYINVQLLLTGIVEEQKELARTWQWDHWGPLLEVPWRTDGQTRESVEPAS